MYVFACFRSPKRLPPVGPRECKYTRVFTSKNVFYVFLVLLQFMSAFPCKVKLQGRSRRLQEAIYTCFCVFFDCRSLYVFQLCAIYTYFYVF